MVPNSLGLVDFPIGQADFSGQLPNRQAWEIFQWDFHGSFHWWLNFGPVQNSYGQVKLKCRLPKCWARIFIFAEPCKLSEWSRQRNKNPSAYLRSHCICGMCTGSEDLYIFFLSSGKLTLHSLKTVFFSSILCQQKCTYFQVMNHRHMSPRNEPSTLCNKMPNREKPMETSIFWSTIFDNITLLKNIQICQIFDSAFYCHVNALHTFVF